MNRATHRPGSVQLLRSDSGAFDVKTTLVATLIGAGLAAVLAVTIFVLIPWSWDNAAKADLEAVKTAESVAVTFEGRFLDGEGLLEKEYLNDSDASDVKTTTNRAGTCFAAVTESRTGKTFFITDWLDNAQEVTPAIRFVDGCAEQIVPDIMSWGAGASGKLGTGDTRNSPKAVPVNLDAEEDIFTVAAGGQHSCAATQFEAWCWGQGGSGQLGDGNARSSREPVKVQLPEGEITALSTGSRHTCAAVDGDIYCWGYSYYGATATPNIHTNTPVKVEGLPDATKLTVTAGADHTCTIADGDVWCWGYNSNGQLGNGNTTTSRVPAKVGALTLTSGATEVTAGSSHTCAVVSGEAWCWGSGAQGKLGNGQLSSQRSPVKVQGLAGTVTAISASHSGSSYASHGGHTCAVASGNIWCWGDNRAGQLAARDITFSALPVIVEGDLQNRTIDFIGTGQLSSCAASGNSVWCWGEGPQGELGHGSYDASPSPRKVSGLVGKEPVTALSVGTTHVLAAMGGAGFPPGAPIDRPYKYPVSGFGSSAYGQLGTGGVASSPVATPADWKPGARVYSPTAGSNHSCALVKNEAWCWGWGAYGQLGDGTKTTRMTPVKVQGLPEGTIDSITAGNQFTCAVVDGEAWCWGDNRDGQLGNGQASYSDVLLPVKVQRLTGVTSISAGSSHACAVADGTAYCWGNGGSHQLGTGTAAQVLVPTPVYGIPLGKKVQSIIAGGSTTCAVVSEAADLYCWGYNNAGQVGDGTTSNRVSPVKVPLPGPVVHAAVGANHACAAVGVNAELYCWGYNTSGQLGLGDGSPTVNRTPVQVPGISNVFALTLGNSHTCVLAPEMLCWGSSSAGQAGNGTTANTFSPTPVQGLPSDKPVTGIAAGGSHSIAVIDGIPTLAPAPVKDDETDYPMKSWGLNSSGQLASGTTNNSLVPTDVDWLPENPVSMVRSGASHSCAVTGEEVWCWGSNDSGQIGDSTTTNRRTPVQVQGLPAGPVTDLQASGNRTCVLINQEAWCWGAGSYYLLGDGNTVNRVLPARVQGLPGTVSSFALGSSHSCAVSEGSAWCWGYGYSNRLGTGTTADSKTPEKVTGMPVGKTVAAVFVGGSHTCAVAGAAAELWCWGSQVGGLGHGAENAASPAKVAGISGVTTVSAGTNFTCAVASGTPYCWGNSPSGQIGQGGRNTAPVPSAVHGLEDITVTDLSATTTGVCAITDGFEAYCWGANTNGQVGNGTTDNASTPVKVAVAGAVTSIGAGVSHTVTVVGGVYTPQTIPVVTDAPAGDYPARAWGEASSGKLGTGSFMAASLPQIVDWKPGAQISRTAAGANHSCAIAGSDVYCWGLNTSGQLGNGTTAAENFPAKVQGLPAGQPSGLQAASSQTCVILAGEAWCWGYNAQGQLGNGNTTNQTLPARVIGLAGVTSIALNSNHSCAIANKQAWCWGSGSDGRLGTGSTNNSITPVEVTGFPLGMGASGIAAGSSHTCAVVGAAADVYCWGRASSGLGNGSSSSIFPVKVGVSSATALVAGDAFTCALSSGATWCWGQGNFGQMGNGTTTATNHYPVRVEGNGTSVDLVAGTNTACTIDSNGDAWCWGHNNTYQIGDGTTANATLPVQVAMGISGPVSSITPGANHAVAAVGGALSPVTLPQLTDKKMSMPVNAWGLNSSYQLGTGTNSNSLVPAVVNWSPDGDVSQVVAGDSFSCALVDGVPWCWGSNTNGRLGDGTTVNSPSPVEVVKTWTGKIVKLSATTGTVCALTESGEVWCWGHNYNGAGGTGASSVLRTAVKVSLPGPASMVSVGDTHGCAVVSDGDLYCWGQNAYSKVAPGAGSGIFAPTLVKGFSAGITKVSATVIGDNFTCAVAGAAADLYCWGYNSSGLGTGGTTSAWPATTGLKGVTLAEAGREHACAVAGEMHCFGRNSNGQLGDGRTTTQGTLSPVMVTTMTETAVTALDLSLNNTCALTAAGDAWCWGAGAQGQLGNGTTTTQSSPVKITGFHAAGPVTSIASGTSHTLAVIDGVFVPTAYPAVMDDPTDQYPVNASGQNNNGQLGIGNMINAASFVPALWEPAGDASQVMAGDGFSCALADGVPWCWGSNSNGRLGDGTTLNSPSPVEVVKTWTGKIVKLSATTGTVCALTESGEVWCWGHNYNGAGGTGASSVLRTAVKVSLPGPASMVDVGDTHGCAVVGDGDLYCWGQNTYSKAVPGGGSGIFAPQLVKGFPAGITKVSAAVVGDNFTCAVAGAAAELYCWGYNSSGLGTGGTTSAWPVTTGLKGVTLAGAGREHACAVAGDLYCFGRNTEGQLGDGRTTTQGTLSPVLVTTMTGTAVTALDLSLNNTCALTAAGDAWCWGAGTHGQLGNGTTTAQTRPVKMTGFHAAGPITSIASGTGHTLAVIDGVFTPTEYPAVQDETTDQYPVNAWGYNNSRQLGTLSGVDSAGPVPAFWMPEKPVVRVAAGANHSCAISGTDLYCWGANGSGELFLGHTNSPVGEPTLVGSGYTDVSAASSYTCAVKDGEVWCGGSNSSGRLGDGTTTTRTTPVKVSLPGPASKVSTGSLHTCAALTDGSAWCWGSGGAYRLGNGSSATHMVPQRVPNVDSVTDISAGAEHTCAVNGGAVFCWGYNSDRRALGITPPTFGQTPTAVPGLTGTATSVTAGLSHTCAVVDGAAWCWGSGSLGALGNGSSNGLSAPARVAGIAGQVRSVFSGSGASMNCATTDVGGVWCWGRNSFGSLGNGTTTNSAVPVQVPLARGSRSVAVATNGQHVLAVLEPVP